MEIKSFTTTVNDFFMIANNEISKFDTNKKPQIAIASCNS